MAHDNDDRDGSRLELLDRIDYTKQEAKKTGRRVKQTLDTAFEKGKHTAERAERTVDTAFEKGRRAKEKAAEVSAPALDEAERMAGEIDAFMEHDPGPEPGGRRGHPSGEADLVMKDHGEHEEAMPGMSGERNRVMKEPGLDEEPLLDGQDVAAESDEKAAPLWGGTVSEEPDMLAADHREERDDDGGGLLPRV